MKRKNYLMTVIVLLIFAWSASSPAADKIGFIDMQEIMFNSVTGKKAMDDFQQIIQKEKRGN